MARSLCLGLTLLALPASAQPTDLVAAIDRAVTEDRLEDAAGLAVAALSAGTDVAEPALAARLAYLVSTLRTVGLDRLQSGDAPGSITVLADALSLAEALIGTGNQPFADLLQLYGAALGMTEDYEGALFYFRQAHDILVALLPADHPTVVEAAGFLHEALQAAAGQSPETHAAHVNNLARRLGPKAPETIRARIQLGHAHWLNGDIETARTVLEAAVADLTSGPGPLLVFARAQLALVLMDLGRVEDAGTLARATFAAIDADPSLEAANPIEAGAQRQLLRVVALDAALATGRYLEALRFARIEAEFATTATGLPTEIDDEMRFLRWGGAAQSVAKAAWGVATLAPAERKGQTDADLMAEAFRAAQFASWGVASAAMARNAVRIAARDAELEEAVTEWEAAKRRSAALSDRLREAGADLSRAADPAALANRAAEAVRAAAALETRLGEAFPDFGALMRPDVVPLAQAQAALGPDDALVLVMPNRSLPDDGGFVWAVTADGAAWARIAPTGALISAMTTLRDGLRLDLAAARAPVSAVQMPADAPLHLDRDLAYRLYSSLFGQPAILDLVRDKSHWIIVPQHPLASLPFAALVTAPPPTGPDTAEMLRRTPWLGTTRALTIAPSVRTLTMPGRSGPPRPARYVAFGDPSFQGPEVALRGNADDLFARADRTAAIRALPRLPATRLEVAAIARAFPGAASIVRLGTDATENALFALSQSGALADASIVHFATHGLLGGAFAGLSEPALALTPPLGPPMPAGSGADTLDDGLLTASEAALLRLDADWVILSACDTAAGGAAGAEGLTGLASAFLFAGAQSLMVSHWAVRDDVAARLSVATVSAHAGGATRAEALRKAMVDVMEDTSQDASPVPLSHPALWAPFQIVGRRD